MQIPLSLWRAVGVVGLYTLVALPASALEIGDKAPAFSATTLSGDAVELSELIGEKPVYLKFWATWCQYCVRELPHAHSVYQRYGDEVAMIMVNVGLNDSVENIQRVYRKAEVSLPTVIDSSGEIVSAYAVVGTPNHVLIDTGGRLSYRSFLATDELDRRLHAIAEAAQEEVAP